MHIGNPGETGANEVSTVPDPISGLGAGYARNEVIFTEATDLGISNDNVLEFKDLPLGDPTHIGFWDARTGGNLLWTGQAFQEPQDDANTIRAGYSVRMPPGFLEASIYNLDRAT